MPRSLFALDRHELGPIWILDEAPETHDIRTFDVDFQVVRNSMFAEYFGEADRLYLDEF